MSQPEALTLLVGTANDHKLQEITRRMKGLAIGSKSGPIAPKSLRIVGIQILPPMDPVAETGTTFAENAGIKARAFAAAARQLPESSRPDFVVADDSGLCVKALDGAPGVYSSRYAGPQATDGDNIRKLLEELIGVPRGERTAEFVCVMACVALAEATDDVLFFAEGRCAGEILLEPRGEAGFGYDPVFFYAPLERCFAELSGEEKNAVSHRGRAVDLLVDKLRERFKAER